MRKTTIRKIFSLIFVAVFVFTYSYSNVMASEYVIPIPNDYSKEFFLAQAESNRVYNQLLDAFKEKFGSANASKGDTSKAYPDYYGGAYIDQKTGNLVVLLTDSCISNKSEVRNMTGNSTNVLFEACEIPLKEMCNVIAFLANKISYLSDIGIEVDCIADDIMNDRILISVINLDSEKEKTIRSLIDCDYLYFENSLGTIEKETELGGGNQIVSAYDGGESTLGFAAMRYGEAGYVISGHAGDFVGEVFKYQGESIGPVSATAYYENSTADAAFVSARSHHTPSQHLASFTTIYGTTDEVALYTPVYMLGASSSLQSGQVVHLGAASTANGITIKDQYLASFDSDFGDSGAPILYYSGGRYLLVGIFRGTKLVDGQIERSVFSKYSNIQIELGVTAITGL